MIEARPWHWRLVDIMDSYVGDIVGGETERPEPDPRSRGHVASAGARQSPQYMLQDAGGAGEFRAREALLRRVIERRIAGPITDRGAGPARADNVQVGGAALEHKGMVPCRR